MTQRDVAEKRTSLRLAIGDGQNHRSFPDTKQIVLLCEIFNYTLNNLFGIHGIDTAAKESVDGF